MVQIYNYADFVNELMAAGFSLGGGGSRDFYSIIPWSWTETPPYKTPVSWHTADPETDPWEWRMRVLLEREDIAYAKLFAKKSGFITKEWYPYFLAIRRGNRSFEEAYIDGYISHPAKRIYEVLKDTKGLSLPEVKRLGGFGKDNKSDFDKALTELQMKMYLTICGRQSKRTKEGLESGWASTQLCTVEAFWGEELIESSYGISETEAIDKISQQIYRLNPLAQPKKAEKIIRG